MELPGTVTQKKSMNIILLLVYVILGVYFLNFPFKLIEIPEYIVKFDAWIIFVGGLLMLFGAINYFKAKRK